MRGVIVFVLVCLTTVGLARRSHRHRSEHRSDNNDHKEPEHGGDLDKTEPKQQRQQSSDKSDQMKPQQGIDSNKSDQKEQHQKQNSNNTAQKPEKDHTEINRTSHPLLEEEKGKEKLKDLERQPKVDDVLEPPLLTRAMISVPARSCQPGYKLIGGKCREIV